MIRARSRPLSPLAMRLSRLAALVGLIACAPSVVMGQDCLGFHRPGRIPTMEVSSGFLRDGVFGPSQLAMHASRGNVFTVLETGADVVGQQSAFAFNGLGATLGYRTTWRRYAVCAGGSLTSESVGTTISTSSQSLLMAMGLPAVRPTRFLPPLAPYGAARIERRSSESDGSDVRSSTGVAFRAGVAAYPLPWLGVRIHEDYGSGAWRLGYSVSARIALGSEDSDRDGVSDRNDRCPRTPRGALVTTDGCEPDEDNDGVPDARDACRGTRPDADVDVRGCEPDEDRDGVPDVRDACPATPRGVPVSANGCPLDSDGDGVFDVVDLCPDTPKGTVVGDRGCPLDGDGDGVPDASDDCPGTPARTVVDGRGCPRVRANITLRGVTFQTGRSILRRSSIATLDTVAEALLADLSATVELAGHTDNVGSNRSNEALSLARARAVRSYLIVKGVAPERMTAAGYGARRPVAPNTSSEGRALNRRVEMTRTDQPSP